MPWLWIWVWIVLLLCALVVLALLAWRLWRQVKALAHELGRAMRRLDELSAALDTLGEAEGRLSEQGVERAGAHGAPPAGGPAPPVERHSRRV